MSHVTSYASELVVLVADLDMENSLRGILGRWQALGIRQLTEGRDFDILRHPERDPGCRGNAEMFLEGFINTHRYALVVFDHHGCGWGDRIAAVDVESNVEGRLEQAGWTQRCAAIVIEPELEAWVWSDSPHVAATLGWENQAPTLRDWLIQKNLVKAQAVKPADPKTAMQQALRQARKPSSPRIFSKLAQTVGLSRCRDRAFLKLHAVLQRWFPPAGR